MGKNQQRSKSEDKENNPPYKHCLNCGVELNGKYCHNCGQRHTPRPLSAALWTIGN